MSSHPADGPLDDLGTPVPLGRPARRVVSLVPSLTESIAATRPETLVGATDWCTHPSGLDVTRVRGTKNPDLAAIRALRPDVVVANQEENRELDVRRLREAGVAVWVTRIETVPEALASMRRMFEEGLGWEVPAWLEEATRRWHRPVPPAHTRVAVPIWRDPWMVVGRDTFTGDLLTRLGYEHVFAGHAERYPKVDPTDIEAALSSALSPTSSTPSAPTGLPGLVLLPDEPYVFTAEDGPEAFAQVPTRLVSGRLLTWYGPSLLAVEDQLGRAEG